MFNPNTPDMRRLLSILVLFLGIAIGVGAGTVYPISKVEASPACPSDNLVSQDHGIAIVPVISAYAWDIPIRATVHPVSFDVQHAHAAYLAELIKPPSVNYINRQATLINYDLSLMTNKEADIGTIQTENDTSLTKGQSHNRMPRDGL